MFKYLLISLMLLSSCSNQMVNQPVEDRTETILKYTCSDLYMEYVQCFIDSCSDSRNTSRNVMCDYWGTSQDVYDLSECLCWGDLNLSLVCEVWNKTVRLNPRHFMCNSFKSGLYHGKKNGKTKK
jgi:hypothetical protein